MLVRSSGKVTVFVGSRFVESMRARCKERVVMVKLYVVLAPQWVNRFSPKHMGFPDARLLFGRLQGELRGFYDVPQRKICRSLQSMMDLLKLLNACMC